MGVGLVSQAIEGKSSAPHPEMVGAAGRAGTALGRQADENEMGKL